MQRDILQGFWTSRVPDPDGGRRKEALRLFEEVPVHLVLIDQRMPDMTGDQVIEQMKKLTRLSKLS